MILGFQCDCSVEVDDGAPTLCTQRILRARKPHICVECGRTINPGEQYERDKGLWEGDWRTQTTCLGCYGIREHFCSSGFYYGEVAHQVRDCLGFDYRDDPAWWDQAEVDEEDEENRALVAKRAADRKDGE